ncbi:MAG TPA: response regulator [Burkholderiales bacterium]|nr:response regulator [Burkholderiales bacterium]
MAACDGDGAGTAGEGRSLRVLIAEDNEVNRALAVRLLARRGHEAVVVGTGLEALAAWEDGRFDLILMDLQMPQMDGLAATAAIRDRERARATYTPIIALTANAASTDEARCLAAGMDAFISKPVRIAAFYKAIAAVLDRDAALHPEETILSQVPEVFDLKTALDAVDGERELLSGMIAIYLRQTPRVMQDIDAAMAAGDAGALEIAAHKLKGSVAMFGARAAREAAQHLEDLAETRDLSQAQAARGELGAEIERLTAALEAVRAEDER